MTGIIEYGNDGNSPFYSTTGFPCISPDYIPTGNSIPGIHLEWQDGGSGKIQAHSDYKEEFHSWFEIVSESYLINFQDRFVGYTGDYNGDGTTDVLF